jgi:MSHA pilin protein MshC
MVVLGVLAAVAMPRLTGNTGFAGAAFRGDIVSALRYAQKTAVSHRRLVCASIGASSVTLSIAQANPSSDCGVALTSPDGEPYTSKNSTIKATGAFLTSGLFFQPSGTITTDGAGTALAVGSISVNEQADIQVQGATGYVE